MSGMYFFMTDAIYIYICVCVCVCVCVYTIQTATTEVFFMYNHFYHIHNWIFTYSCFSHVSLLKFSSIFIPIRNINFFFVSFPFLFFSVFIKFTSSSPLYFFFFFSPFTSHSFLDKSHFPFLRISIRSLSMARVHAIKDVGVSTMATTTYRRHVAALMEPSET